MGAVERNDNVKVRNKKRNNLQKQKPGKQFRGNQPPSLFGKPFPSFGAMRPRPPFPAGRMPPPGMGPPMRMGPPPPPPLFRGRVGPPLPPHRMGPLPPPPPHMGMRPRPPLMGPPPLMRPPPPMMGPRRFPPRMPPPPPPPPPMLPPNKMRHLKNKMMAKNKNPKRKNSPGNNLDLSRPWVTAAIKMEFEKKEALLCAAKASDNSSSWDAFKAQRSRCDKMWKTAKLEYIGQHPEEVFDDNSDNFCEACERGFANSEQLERHLQEHRECGIDGCKFAAHFKIVEKHIEMQHVTGLYYRIAKTNTPEDIAKWIEERKKRYPSKENIQKRQEEQEEMMKRGERIQPHKQAFGKHHKKVPTKDGPQHSANKRNKRNKTTFKKPEATPTTKNTTTTPTTKNTTTTPTTISLIDSRANWNGNMAPFEGTSQLYLNIQEEPESQSTIDDNVWMRDETSEAPKIELNNALGALIGAYRSDDSDDEIIVPKQYIDPPNTNISSIKVIKEDTNEDDEAPEELKILKEQPLCFEDSKSCDSDNSKNQERFRKRGRNRKRPATKVENEEKEENTLNKCPNKKPKLVSQRITLLERLLAADIKHERNVILQCVRYTVQKHFFKAKASSSSEIIIGDIQDVKKSDQNILSTENCHEIVDNV